MTKNTFFYCSGKMKGKPCPNKIALTKKVTRKIQLRYEWKWVE